MRVPCGLEDPTWGKASRGVPYPCASADPVGNTSSAAAGSDARRVVGKGPVAVQYGFVPRSGLKGLH